MKSEVGINRNKINKEGENSDRSRINSESNRIDQSLVEDQDAGSGQSFTENQDDVSYHSNDSQVSPSQTPRKRHTNEKYEEQKLEPKQ